MLVYWFDNFDDHFKINKSFLVNMEAYMSFESQSYLVFGEVS